MPDREQSPAAHEVDRLLALAEELDDKVRAVERRIDAYQLLSALLAVSSLVVAAFAMLGRFELPATFSVLGIAYILLTIVMLWRVIRTTSRRIEADRRALREVLAVLREFEQVVAHREQWSPLQRAEYRIRLSRFGV